MQNHILVTSKQIAWMFPALLNVLVFVAMKVTESRVAVSNFRIRLVLLYYIIMILFSLRTDVQ